MSIITIIIMLIAFVFGSIIGFIIGDTHHIITNDEINHFGLPKNKKMKL